MADEVLVAVEAGIATVTLNRPDQRNAMNTALLRVCVEPSTPSTSGATCAWWW